MRKLHLVLLFLLCTPLLYAQDFTKLVNKFKDAEKATYQVVDKGLIPKEVPAIEKIQEVIVLSLDECNAKVKREFNKTIRNLKVKDPYQILIKSEEDDEYTLILSRIKDKLITEIVILNIDDDDSNFIWVKGEGLSMSDLNMGKFL